jgi:superfamily II DNA helicase RecQ
MPFEYFSVMARQREGADALNAFLAAHRVLRVRQHFVEQGDGSYWAVCVEYLGEPPRDRLPDAPSRRRESVDYRTVLPGRAYDCFERLRTARNEWADQESIRPYLIFTNQQLAQMVQRQVRTKTDLEQIAGIGEARVARYGDRVLRIVHEMSEAHHAANGESFVADCAAGQPAVGGVEGAAGPPGSSAGG